MTICMYPIDPFPYASYNNTYGIIYVPWYYNSTKEWFMNGDKIKVREGFPSGSTVKNLPAMQEMQVQSLGQEDPLEEGMATHSSMLAWRIPWSEEPDRLQSIESQRVRYDSMHTCMQD